MYGGSAGTDRGPCVDCIRSVSCGVEGGFEDGVGKAAGIGDAVGVGELHIGSVT